MKRSNHQLQGVLFVVVCVLVALVAYMAIHGSARKNNDGNVQAAALPGNSSTIDVSAIDVPADVSNDTAPQEESGTPVDETAEDMLRGSPTEVLSPAELSERQAKANAERGDCQGIVNADVSEADGSGLSISTPGVLNHVTQLLRDKATGETVFCTRDNHCYPTNVEQAGRSVVAIELPFCEVEDKPSRTVDGIEAYPVVWSYERR